jgi:hypothetical protein
MADRFIGSSLGFRHLGKTVKAKEEVKSKELKTTYNISGGVS